MSDPAEAFLAHLARMTRAVEGQVIWATGAGWQAQDAEAEMLDAEEIAFYAEGMLLEGFHLHWQLLAEAGKPVLARLFFWQGPRAALPAAPDGLSVTAESHWPPAAGP